MHFSVPMTEDITLTNKISQNLHAELQLRLLGKLFGAEGSFEEGTRVVRQFLVNAGVDDNDFFLYDGSGMSTDDRIAPRVFTKLLTYASRAAVGRGVARDTARSGRGRHAGRALQKLAAEGPAVGQDRNAE